MTYFDSLDFAYRIVFTRFDFVTWLWAIAAFVASLVLLHLAWGRLWNSQWAMFRRPGVAVASILIGLFVGVSVLTLLAANRGVEWLDQQRTELVRQRTDCGSCNRRILVEARKRSGQVSVPDDNAMVLHNEQDLSILAEVAAEDVHCPLTPSGPLGPGAPCHVRDPVSVAQAVVGKRPTVSFPVTVSPENPWIKAAVTAQLEEALSYATPKLRAGMTELKDGVLVLLWLALGIQFVMVPSFAVADIRIHPTV
jgi:hypothetical protein